MSHYPSPQEWADELLYFLLPDRFSDNNEDGFRDLKNNPVAGHTPLFSAQRDADNAIRIPTDASNWRAAGGRFVGGNLKGITSKLGYLKRLGVTSLWIGPLFKQNPNDPSLYHGYSIQDFNQVDPQFGTREDLKDMVSKAHENGLYVILDIILNHAGDVFDYIGGPKSYNGRKYAVKGFRDPNRNPTVLFQQMADSPQPTEEQLDSAIWPRELQDPSCWTCKGAINNWDAYPEYLDGDFLTLKDINLGPAEADGFVPTPALKTLCKIYKDWIAYADLDGYRIDTVKHMGDGPARYFASVIHEYAQTLGKNNFLLVGEITGARAWETVELTGLNAALGIGNIQEKLWKLPKGLSNPADYFDLFRNALYLGHGTQSWTRNKIVTMIDDHDQVWRGGMDKARFCAVDQDADLMLAAIALNLTTLGIPCIYYGSEQCFDGTGGNDRYIREALFGGAFGPFRSRNCHCFNEETTVYREIGKIAALRRKHMPLRRGRQYLRQISGDGVHFDFPKIISGPMRSVVAWSRISADAEILCAINTDPDNRREAWVTVDSEIQAERYDIVLIYSSRAADARQRLEVENRNGRAVLVTVPAGGFVMYK